MRKVTRKSTTKLFVAPELPPKSEEEVRQSAELVEQMKELSRMLRQRNLDNAVALAQQAARGQGPLIDHFCELGRRYNHLLGIAPKPGLRVIQGGAGD